MDFTLSVFKSMLTALQDSGNTFLTVTEFSRNKKQDSFPQIILRHDIDKKPKNSLITARIEHGLGIIGTYYFRIIPGSYSESIIKEIDSLGHEIGYHYEDLQLARQKTKDKSRRSKVESRKSGSNGEEEMAAMAIDSFRGNLARLRDIVPVDTICMHGSPLSPADSRVLWKYYDYRTMGIIAEPYFDFSLEDMLYLTDTGRRWDGSSVSIRDRGFIREEGYYAGWKRRPVIGSAMLMTEKSDKLQRQFKFRKTDNILQAISSGNLPERLMITFHPQRWNDSTLPWLKEYLWQNSKNVVKYLMVKRF
jgi:hypothetical protein